MHWQRLLQVLQLQLFVLTAIFLCGDAQIAAG
jgi:hypothetical protein